jgi:hypothetical protein
MTDMREQIATIIEDTYDISRTYEVTNIPDIADAIIAALPGMVKPLEWAGDDIFQTSGEYRLTYYAGMTVPYKLEFGVWVKYFETEEAAKSHAENDNCAQIMAAFGIGESE